MPSQYREAIAVMAGIVWQISLLHRYACSESLIHSPVHQYVHRTWTLGPGFSSRISSAPYTHMWYFHTHTHSYPSSSLYVTDPLRALLFCWSIDSNLPHNLLSFIFFFPFDLFSLSGMERLVPRHTYSHSVCTAVSSPLFHSMLHYRWFVDSISALVLVSYDGVDWSKEWNENPSHLIPSPFR